MKVLTHSEAFSWSFASIVKVNMREAAMAILAVLGCFWGQNSCLDPLEGL